MAAQDGPAESAYLVKGDDPAVLAQQVRALLHRLVGDRDPALVVEEHGGPGAEELDISAVVDACTTPPFLVDRRVVVVREAGRLSAADASRLAGIVADPPPSTVLVLAGGGGTVPRTLQSAVQAHGLIIDSSVGTGRDRSRWMSQHLLGAPVHLEAAAASRLSEHLGEDVGRVQGLLETLAAAYGAGARIGVDELEPYLGAAGAVPPWDLTDAIDRGETTRALEVLGRMVSAGGRAAPEVVAILHRHYQHLLVLDGPEVRSTEDAAARIGSRSTFVAKKALAQARSLGSDRTGQAIALLAAADLDVKGRTGLAPELVLEILVARLSRLARPARGRAPARR